MSEKKKLITTRERKLATVIAETGLGSIEAVRRVFGWRCETVKEQQKARDLVRSARVQEEIDKIKAKLKKEAEAEQFVSQAGSVDMSQMHEYVISELYKIRNDNSNKSSTRFNALKLLEKMYDPSSDQSLILKWIDFAWGYQEAHCPCCHKSFPLSTVKNKKLEKYREQTQVEVLPSDPNIEILERRLRLIKKMDPRNTPHASQTPTLAAPERHVVGKGAARGGKSYLLALLAAMAFLLPGVEIWILARVYEDARSEVEYIKRFLNALFYPYKDDLIKEHWDRKSGELSLTSKWGSELRVRSAKSKGSITGRALELALVAEPGWVEGDIYEELRARMSERLGRIIALGTPKGTSGFIGRMTRTFGRDPKTGRFVRRQPHERLIENGSDWNVSMLEYTLDPRDNPSYVKSEQDAARQELTDSEYQSEFEGMATSIDGAKFAAVKQSHLQVIPRYFFERAKFILGIDQGQTNFGASLTAYDGKLIVPCWEFYNGKDTDSMQRNLLKLRKRVPGWIRTLGGDPQSWALTICDVDPPLLGDFQDLEDQNLKWPTDLSFRPKNKTTYLQNWRRETQEFVNNAADNDKLLFCISDAYSTDGDEAPGSQLLHDQVVNVIDVPQDPQKESASDSRKGWEVNDPWRGDHVLDAWYFTMWVILNGEIEINEFAGGLDPDDPWASAKAAWDYNLAVSEANELRGLGRSSYNQSKKLYESAFKKKWPGGRGSWHYPDD